MDDRILPNTETVYTANDEIPRQHPAGVEGQEMSGEVWLKVVMKSETMLMLQVFREKGVKDPVQRRWVCAGLTPQPSLTPVMLLLNLVRLNPKGLTLTKAVTL